MKHELARFEAALACAISALCALVVWIGTERYGIGISPDSVAYVSAGRSFAEGRGFFSYDGQPLLYWGPLYSFGIGILNVISTENDLRLLRVVHVFLAALNAFLVWHLLTIGRDRRSGFYLRLVTTAAVALTFPLLKQYVMAWSEPVFITLTLIAILALGTLERRSSKVLLCITCMLLPLQRYSGVPVVLVIGALSVITQNGTFRSSLNYAVTATVCGLLPIGLWFLRNIQYGQGPYGKRPPSTSSLGSVLSELSITIQRFEPVPFLVLGVTLLFIVSVVMNRSIIKDRMVMITGSLTGAYLAFLVYSKLATAMEPLSVRYVSPLVPLFALVLCHAMALSRFSLQVAYGLAAFTWVAFASSITQRGTEIWAAEGAGDYTHISWMESPTLMLARPESQSSIAFSNAADFLYMEGWKQPLPLPFNTPHLPVPPDMTSDQRVFVVWFKKSFRPGVLSPAVVRQSNTVIDERETADGLIMEVRPD